MSFQIHEFLRGRRVEGGPRRRFQTPGSRPPKGFNVSGFSELLTLYFLNLIIPAAGNVNLGQQNSAARGVLTPVAPQIRDVAGAQEGFITAPVGVSADVTTDFTFDYSMHMSAWLYSGMLVADWLMTQTAATITLQSIRVRIQHVRNNVQVGRDLFDSGTLSDGTSGTHSISFVGLLPFVEYFAVGDILRALLTIRVTTNATGNGTVLAVNRAGMQPIIYQPHMFLHAQPTQETGNQALFARRV